MTEIVDRWVSVKELAAALSTTERSVRRWMTAGEPSIEVLRIGKKFVRVRIVRTCPHTSSCNPERGDGKFINEFAKC